MQITIESRKSTVVELSESNVNEVTINRLKQLIAPGEFIRKKGDKVLLMQDDPNWRHGSVGEELIREATELDLAVVAVIYALRQKNRIPK
jgi:hypothetical protein